MRFSGTLSKPGTATVNGAPATMDGTTRFSASPVLSPGAQNVPVTATDTSGNVRNQTYALTVGNAGSRTFAYDANGNMTNNGAGQTYEWDAADRLYTITQSGNVTKFVYNGTGQRVQEKLNNTVIKQWVWCPGEPQPCEERDGSNNVTKRFYAGLGQQIGGTNYYYTTDHLGSIRELTDATGAVRARYDYDPYGRTTKTSGDLESDFGFTGYFRHQASGLGLAIFRAYDADLGRWLSRDPIAERGGVNLYGYVENGPTNYTDSTGLFLDTLLDVASIGYDLYRIGKDNVFGNCDNLGTNLSALGADALSALIPFAAGGGIAVRAGRALKTAESGIQFGQASVKATFAHGPHAGKTIGEVAAGLRSGAISPNSLPVEYVMRNGQAVALNNRSLLALKRAGLEPTVTRNLTGNRAAAATLMKHLRGGAPSDVIRVRGGPSNASLIK